MRLKFLRKMALFMSSGAEERMPRRGPREYGGVEILLRSGTSVREDHNMLSATTGATSSTLWIELGTTVTGPSGERAAMSPSL